MWWTHPWDRQGAGPELKLLGQAWLTHIAAQGGYGEDPSPTPEWAQAVIDGFCAQNPDFDPATGLTAAWQADKTAAYAAADAALSSAKDDRKAAITAALLARDWPAIVALGAVMDELPQAQIGSALWRAMMACRQAVVFGRGDRACAIKK